MQTRRLGVITAVALLSVLVLSGLDSMGPLPTWAVVGVLGAGVVASMAVNAYLDGSEQ